MPALIARLLAVTLAITIAALIVVAFFAPPAHAQTLTERSAAAAVDHAPPRIQSAS